MLIGVPDGLFVSVTIHVMCSATYLAGNAIAARLRCKGGKLSKRYDSHRESSCRRMTNKLLRHSDGASK